VYYGLIEWDGYRTPTIIIGTTYEAVERTAVQVIKDVCGDRIMDDGTIPHNFLDDNPYPNLNNAEAVADWLYTLRDVTTVPYFTLLNGDEIVEAK